MVKSLNNIFKKIFLYIIWQSTSRPKRLVEFILLILYLALEIFYIYGLCFFLSDYISSEIIYIASIVYLGLNALSFGACMDLFVLEKSKFFFFQLIILIGILICVNHILKEEKNKLYGYKK